MRLKTKVIIALIGSAILMASAAVSQDIQMFNVTPQPLTYYFMAAHLKNEKGETDNQKFFLGPLPQEGDAVEMIYVGSSAEGEMHFQLRTKK